MSIPRGSTPTHIFHTAIDLSEADAVWLTYKQGSNVVLNKQIEDLVIDAESVTATLSQKEALMFSKNSKVRIQIRARFSNGVAVQSNIVETDVDDVLKEGVI